MGRIFQAGKEECGEVPSFRGGRKTKGEISAPLKFSNLRGAGEWRPVNGSLWHDLQTHLHLPKFHRLILNTLSPPPWYGTGYVRWIMIFVLSLLSTQAYLPRQQTTKWLLILVLHSTSLFPRHMLCQAGTSFNIVSIVDKLVGEWYLLLLSTASEVDQCWHLVTILGPITVAAHILLKCDLAQPLGKIDDSFFPCLQTKSSHRDQFPY